MDAREKEMKRLSLYVSVPAWHGSHFRFYMRLMARIWYWDVATHAAFLRQNEERLDIIFQKTKDKIAWILDLHCVGPDWFIGRVDLVMKYGGWRHRLTSRLRLE